MQAASFGFSRFLFACGLHDGCEGWLRLRSLFYDYYSRATASAPLAKGVGDAEKFLALSMNASGNVIVTRVGILTGQGGNISSFISGAGAIAHVHYRGLLQPPVGGDHSAVKFRNISSFVIGYNGRKIWEVGRIDGAYKTRSVNGATPGQWEDY